MKRMLIVLVLILLVGGGFYLFRQVRSRATTSEITPNSQNTGSPSPTAPLVSTQPTTAAGPTATNENNQIVLSIDSPKDGSIVNSPSVMVRGKTVANAEVFINDSQLQADASGNFSLQLTLDEGDNTILISANDANGNSSEQEIVVTYEPS